MFSNSKAKNGLLERGEAKRPKGDAVMLKEFAWKAFESTGDIDMYIFLKEIEEKDVMVDEIPVVGEGRVYEVK